MCPLRQECPHFYTFVTPLKIFKRTDVRLIWDDVLFLLFYRGSLAPYSIVMDEHYCSLLFCLQLDIPLPYFGSVDRQTDGQGQI